MALAILLAAVEMVTVTTVVVWSALAALVTAVVLWLAPGLGGAGQIALFGLGSIAFTFAGRAVVGRFGERQEGGTLNRRAAQIVGREAVVDRFDHDEGQVTVDGVPWPARLEDGRGDARGGRPGHGSSRPTASWCGCGRSEPAAGAVADSPGARVGAFFCAASRVESAKKPDKSSRRQALHKIPVATTLVVALGVGGCAGANRPFEKSAAPMARAEPAAGGELRRMAEQLPRAGARRGHSSRGSSTRPSPAFGVNAEVVRLDGRQAEFTKPIWEYLDGAASPARDRDRAGRSARSSTTRSRRSRRRYGVDRQAVLAIWGMETNFGKNRGSMPVIESLATLAYDGPPPRLRRGAADRRAAHPAGRATSIPAHMRGSWAGAMGHTQFMPTSYLSYAVDFTGDGRRDVWSDDPTDALASTANYLKRSGWTLRPALGRRGAAAGGLQLRQRRPVEHPAGRRLAGARGDADGRRAAARPRPAAIIAPAGARGPAFAVYDNFFVIKNYNNATSYAMGVGHLGDRIMGGGPVRRAPGRAASAS